MLRKLDIPWLILLVGVVWLSTQLWQNNPPANANGHIAKPSVEWYVADTGIQQAVPQSIDMTNNRIFVLHGKLGDSTVQIDNGRVRFTQSPCQHQICVQSGWISEAGEVLACLPNQVAIHLRYHAEQPQPIDDEAVESLDAVSF